MEFPGDSFIFWRILLAKKIYIYLTLGQFIMVEIHTNIIVYNKLCYIALYSALSL